MENNPQIKVALSKLTNLKSNKLRLDRPVFFVPGWTDEAAAAWRQPLDGHRCIEQWFKDVVSNPEFVYFVDFSAEATSCQSFLDFGEVLKKQVRAVVKDGGIFDLVCYSM